MKKPVFITPYIILDLMVGACIGFFILHPLSMFIQHKESFFQHSLGHFFLTNMSLYFAFIGIGLGGISGYFRMILRKKNFELAKQQELILRKNRNFEASITNARHIQQAMLTKIEEIKQYLPKCFILYKPKGIVSGDLYWFKKLDEIFFLAAVDCTGHGVPGAVLSMIANDLLNEIVTEFKIHSPELILNKLHELLRDTLHQDNSGNQDGMDISLIVMDTKEKIVYYAGAKSPLIYIQNNVMNIIKADRNSIGGFHNFAKPIYQKHSISVKEPTMLYLFSDGFQDQFGGKQKGKYKTIPFRKLLFNIHTLPVKDQKDKIDLAFESWRGMEPQTDDVLVIGLKLN